MKEKDEALQNLLNHVQSLQDEVQQLSGLFHHHGATKPLISDLVGHLSTFGRGGEGFRQC